MLSMNEWDCQTKLHTSRIEKKDASYSHRDYHYSFIRSNIGKGRVCDIRPYLSHSSELLWSNSLILSFLLFCSFICFSDTHHQTSYIINYRNWTRQAIGEKNKWNILSIWIFALGVNNVNKKKHTSGPKMSGLTRDYIEWASEVGIYSESPDR